MHLDDQRPWVATRNHRSWLEARWAEFFREAGIRADYEPEKMPGWWPDFRVYGIKIGEQEYSALAEVKPVAFSPVSVDPKFNKAISARWTLCLGNGPEGDYIGFLVTRRDEKLATMGVRLGYDGLEVAPLNENKYGSHAKALWKRVVQKLPNPGVQASLNNVAMNFLEKRVDGNLGVRETSRGVSNAEGV